MFPHVLLAVLAKLTSYCVLNLSCNKKGHGSYCWEHPKGFFGGVGSLEKKIIYVDSYNMQFVF